MFNAKVVLASDMAGGGDAAPVEPWDLASLIGAIVLLSTILMFAWPPSHNVELDGDRKGLSEIDVGMLGSADIIEISLKNSTACERDNLSCTGAVVHILSPNGDEIVNQRLTPGESYTSERLENGPVKVTSDTHTVSYIPSAGIRNHSSFPARYTFCHKRFSSMTEYYISF